MRPYVERPDDLLTELLSEADLRARFVGSLGAPLLRGFFFPGSFDAAVHVVLKGSAWIGAEDEMRRQVERGGVVFLPKDAASLVLGSPGAEPLMPPAGTVAPRVLWAELAPADAIAFSILTVACEYQNRRSRPLLGALPKAMYFTLPSDLVERAERIAAGSAGLSPGANFATHRNAEGLFCEIVALAIARLDAPAGWLPAMRDDQMTPVLHAIHTTPGASWSLQRLARLAGLSRTAFCRRFAELTGMSGAEYVRHVRVRRASSMLRTSALSIAEVANAVGYESESSFSRAFFATTGERPGAIRYAFRGITVPIEGERVGARPLPAAEPAAVSASGPRLAARQSR